MIEEKIDDGKIVGVVEKVESCCVSLHHTSLGLIKARRFSRENADRLDRRGSGSFFP